MLTGPAAAWDLPGQTAAPWHNTLLRGGIWWLEYSLCFRWKVLQIKFDFGFQNGVHREVRGHYSAFQWQIHQDSTRSAWCVECLCFITGIWYYCCRCQSSVFLFPAVITEFTLWFDVLLSQCPQSPYYVSLQTEVRRRGRTRGSTSRMEGPGLETEMRWDGHF